MDNKEKILKAEELLKVNKQENVLNFLKKLSEDKQIKLAEKIINLNFEQLNKLYAETKTEPEIRPGRKRSVCGSAVPVPDTGTGQRKT